MAYWLAWTLRLPQGWRKSIDVNTGFLANRISVVENQFEAGFWFY